MYSRHQFLETYQFSYEALLVKHPYSDGAILSLEKHPSQKNELRFFFHLPGNRERPLRLRRDFSKCALIISDAQQTFCLPLLPDYLYKCLLAHNVLQLKFNIFSGQILFIKRVCIATAQSAALIQVTTL